jgi:hypothetical protein
MRNGSKGRGVGAVSLPRPAPGPTAKREVGWAFDYYRGNRAALGWIPVKSRETKPNGPSIRKRPNTHSIAGQKEKTGNPTVLIIEVRAQKIAVPMRAPCGSSENFHLPQTRSMA